MKKINIKWLKRIQAAVDKQNRTIPLGQKDARCNKEILVCRYFKFLENRCFKIKIKGETYYAFFTICNHTSTGINATYKYISYGVTFTLGYSSSEYNISFYDEKLNIKEFRGIHWNDIIKIEYKEISKSRYTKIVKLFI